MKFETKYFTLDVPIEQYESDTGNDIEESMNRFLSMAKPFLESAYKIGYQKGSAEATIALRKPD